MSDTPSPPTRISPASPTASAAHETSASAARSIAAAARPDVIHDTITTELDVREEPLGLGARLYAKGWLRKTAVLVVLALVWELYARWLGNPLLFPTFISTLGALAGSIASGELPAAGVYTLSLLIKGYAAGLAIAAILTAFASATRIGADLLETLTAMFNPLPSIALLPLALIWFGLGEGSVIFVLIHAVLWAVALNTFSGFKALSPTLKMVGQNYGLSGLGYVCRILIPGAFASILTGLKVGWAFAWRTLIAAELVFGVSSGDGGLGWYIFENKNQLLIPETFAGLLMVIVFGLFVDNVVFRIIETHTVRKWGMST